MSRILKFFVILLVVLPVLGLAAIGLVTTAFVARVGLHRTNELGLQALTEAIGKAERTGQHQREPGRPPPEPPAQPKSGDVQTRAKPYPEAVRTYEGEIAAKAPQECLDVVDDPDKLLDCIRKANPAGDALRNASLEVEGQSLDIAGLPEFDPLSSAALRVRDGESAIDFVTLRFSERNPSGKPTARIGFQNLQASRFLVLHGPANTEWLLDSSRPKELSGVLLIVADETPRGRILGVPEGVPVWRYTSQKNSRKLLPFITGIIPRCYEREGGSVECVNGPRGAFFARADQRTPFQVVDDWSLETLGQRLSTVSSLSSSRSGLVIVPREIIDDATRKNLETELARAKLLLAENKVRIERRNDYSKRWLAERFAAATADLPERPPFNPSEAASRAGRIVVASIYEPLTKGHLKSKTAMLYDSYEEYKARADLDVRPVAIRVRVEEPAILILTSYYPVRWVVEIARPEMITAVQIEGLNVPSFEGIPKHIPVRLRSLSMGDRSAVHFLDPKAPKTEEALRNFRSEFAGLPVKLVSNYSADFVEIPPD